MAAHRPIFFAKNGCVVPVLGQDLIDALGVIERKSFVIVPGTVDGDVVVHMGDVMRVPARPKRCPTWATDGGVGVVAVEGCGAVVFQRTKVWQRQSGILVVSLPGPSVCGFAHKEEEVGVGWVDGGVEFGKGVARKGRWWRLGGGCGEGSIKENYLLPWHTPGQAWHAPGGHVFCLFVLEGR